MTRQKINKVCILSVINPTQDKAININDNVWAISTLQNDKNIYFTCLQFSYTTKLHFPYDIIYFPNDHDANAISFVLPSNNKLHVESSIETPQYKLGFSRSYSKINTFSLMQSLILSSLTDDKLQDLAHKILEMKQMSIFSINNTFTKLRTYPNNFWSSIKVKKFSTLGNHRYFSISNWYNSLSKWVILQMFLK